jgi:hypothetical protein
MSAWLAEAEPFARMGVLIYEAPMVVLAWELHEK